MKNQNHFPKVPNMDTGIQMTSLLSQLNSKASILTRKSPSAARKYRCHDALYPLPYQNQTLWSCSTRGSLHLNSLSEINKYLLWQRNLRDKKAVPRSCIKTWTPGSPSSPQSCKCFPFQEPCASSHPTIQTWYHGTKI